MTQINNAIQTFLCDFDEQKRASLLHVLRILVDLFEEAMYSVLRYTTVKLQKCVSPKKRKKIQLSMLGPLRCIQDSIATAY